MQEIARKLGSFMSAQISDLFTAVKRVKASAGDARFAFDTLGSENLE